jgi:hypothetical protein
VTVPSVELAGFRQVRAAGRIDTNSRGADIGVDVGKATWTNVLATMLETVFGRCSILAI